MTRKMGRLLCLPQNLPPSRRRRLRCPKQLSSRNNPPSLSRTRTYSLSLSLSLSFSPSINLPKPSGAPTTPSLLDAAPSCVPLAICKTLHDQTTRKSPSLRLYQNAMTAADEGKDKGMFSLSLPSSVLCLPKDSHGDYVLLPPLAYNWHGCSFIKDHICLQSGEQKMFPVRTPMDLSFMPKGIHCHPPPKESHLAECVNITDIEQIL